VCNNLQISSKKGKKDFSWKSRKTGSIILIRRPLCKKNGRLNFPPQGKKQQERHVQANHCPQAREEAAAIQRSNHFDAFVWDDLSEFFKYPGEIRRAINTTNAIESLNYQLKILYLAVRNAPEKWTMPIKYWGQALNQFAIEFGRERVPLL